FSILHRPSIPMPTPKHKIQNREYHYDTIDQDIPVHVDRLRVLFCREERHDECKSQEQDAEDVDRETEAAKREAAGKKLLAAQTLEGDAGYGDDVGGDQG